MCSRKFPFYILKLITMKKLTKTFLASAALTLAAGSAFAESFQVNGTVTDNACVLKFFPNGGTVSSVNIPIGNITVQDLGLAVGYPTNNNTGVPITIKAQTAAGTVCSVNNQGVTITQFNTIWDVGTAAKLVIPNFGTKAANAQSSANGPAANVTIDLLPSGTNAKTTGLDLAGANAAAQHGLSAAALATGQVFTAKFFKTNTTRATAGSVAVNYTATAIYN